MDNIFEIVMELIMQLFPKKTREKLYNLPKTKWNIFYTFLWIVTIAVTFLVISILYFLIYFMIQIITGGDPPNWLESIFEGLTYS